MWEREKQEKRVGVRMRTQKGMTRLAALRQDHRDSQEQPPCHKLWTPPKCNGVSGSLCFMATVYTIVGVYPGGQVCGYTNAMITVYMR